MFSAFDCEPFPLALPGTSGLPESVDLPEAEFDFVSVELPESEDLPAAGALLEPVDLFDSEVVPAFEPLFLFALLPGLVGLPAAETNSKEASVKHSAIATVPKRPMLLFCMGQL
jgi:hypothetical protein